MNDTKKSISAEEFLNICRGYYKRNTDYDKYYKKVNGVVKHVSFAFHKIEGVVTFENFEFGWPILIHLCEFENDIHFQSGSFLNNVTIHECKIFGSIEFGKRVVFNGLLDITDCLLEKKIDVLGGKFDDDFDINIRGESEQPSIFIKSGKFHKLSIGGGIKDTLLKTLDIATIGVQGKIFVYGYNKLDDQKKRLKNIFTTKIDNLNISNFSSDLSLYLENFNVNKFALSSFTNSKKFKIHNIAALYTKGKEAEFKIQNSNLGFAEISNVRLHMFNYINIRDSYISDTNFVNTMWPLKVTSYEQNGNILIMKVKKEDKKGYYYKNRDVYRQLKYASSKYGNIVSSQSFYAREMNAYRKSIYWKWQLGVWLILTFSQWTSNYGLSIKRPLISLFIVHSILFSIIYLTGELELISFNDSVYKYFYLLSPIRLNIFSDNWTIVVDMLMRIWSSYMIYNFVRASRRFIK